MTVPTCPTCRRPLEGPMSEWPRFPFCSRKCKLIDLGRWFDERYGLPAEEPDDDLPAEGPEDR
jgi:endogenous inhibitor of DNA gyrase (YacG/DUF329 family)